MKSARRLAAISSLTVALSAASGVIAGAWTQRGVATALWRRF